MTKNLTELRSALHAVIDPEVGIDIVELGLVYGLASTENGVRLDLTMTSPACPMGEEIVAEADEVLRENLPPGSTVEVNLVWEPAWSPARMSDRARRALGWDE